MVEFVFTVMYWGFWLGLIAISAISLAQLLGAA